MAGALLVSAGQARAADGPPLVETGSADYVPGDASFPDGIEQLNGNVNAFGIQITECYFEYGTTTSYGSRTEGYGESCNPGFSLAGDESKAVAGKILNPSPNTVYHYRLVARNAFGFGIGGDRTFGQAVGEPPPGGGTGEEPGSFPTQPTSPAQPGSPPPASSPSFPQTTGSGCPAIKLIGVRGSGERQGLGKPVGAFTKALRRELGWYFTASPVDYPARVWPGRYEGSVKDGVKDLTIQIASDPCHSETRYILVGYSQGAQVIGDAIEDHKLGWYRDRILVTVFFGDPKFDPNADGVRLFGSFNREKGGVFTGAPWWDSRKRNALKGYNVLSYCRRTDPFCQANLNHIREGKYAGHEHYQDYEAQQAARLVAAEVR
jgi:hypothetical protein